MMFATPFSSIAFCRQVAEAATGKAGKSLTTGSHHPTLWIAPTGLGDESCYVYASDGALDIARAAGLDAPVVSYALAAELPQTKCLFLGDVPGDAAIDRKAQSAALLALCLDAAARQPRSRTPAEQPSERAEVF
jgi:hypothetical protein